MSLTSILRSLCMFAIGLGLVLPALAAADGPKKKNVLFIVADDLNCDLGCYGHKLVKSPAIDGLAARGVRFANAYCQFPLCSPSRTSFLTGRRPNATHVWTNPKAGRFSTDYDKPSPHFREFIPDTVTMPQCFRQAGYQVARIGKLYHYGVPGQVGTSGLDDLPSWNYFVNPAGRDKAEEHLIKTLVPNSYGGTLSWLAAKGTDLEQTDGLAATAAISLLESYRDQPFFLAVGFYRPHTPYVAPEKYFEHYPRESIPLPALSDDDKTRTPALAYGSAKPEQEQMSDETRREAMQAYWASITFMDAQVGRVLHALERLGLAESTIVVFTSDHGYHMYEHGLWQKMSLFENSAHVPLIIAAPGQPSAGKSTAALSELVDIYPTLAELAGLNSPAYLDGTSLVPVLADPSKTVKPYAYTQVTRGQRDGISIRTPQYRYTLWDGGKEGEQLYDLSTDAGESKNLAADPKLAAVVQELKGKAIEYMKGK